MYVRSFLMVMFLAFVSLVTPAQAGEFGTPAEAKAMAERAAAYVKEHGPEAAFKVFTEGGEGFKDRDLYVFVNDNSGKVTAHGANPNLVGKNLLEAQDFNGKQFVKEIIAVKDTGIVNYMWQNPVNKKIRAKSAYVVRVGEYTVGVGAYTD